MITYQVEVFTDIIDEIKDLIPLHWDEVACNKDVIKLDPDWEQYKLLVALGKIHMVTVRDDKKLVGYFITVITNDLHYRTVVTATTDIFFLLKEYRKGFAGYKLFKILEDTLKCKGVTKIHTGCKVSLDISPMLYRLGYKEIEKTFSKLL